MSLLVLVHHSLTAWTAFCAPVLMSWTVLVIQSLTAWMALEAPSFTSLRVLSHHSLTAFTALSTPALMSVPSFFAKSAMALPIRLTFAGSRLFMNLVTPSLAWLNIRYIGSSALASFANRPTIVL